MESILGEITRAIRRDKIAAHELLNKSNINISMSTVTMMELMLGAFNKMEINYIQKAFKNINIIYII
jgi:hypothetical protein